jgi:hypothetical protein
VLEPDLWRGNIADFFDWLSGNNGAHRLLEARFGVSAPASTPSTTGRWRTSIW